MEASVTNRRKFLQQLAIGTTALGLGRSFAFAPAPQRGSSVIHIGWITDLHHGYMQDATERLQAFLSAAKKRKLHFILQGGDFCHPTEEAKPFVQLWNEYPGEKYHVLGNHDMDKGNKEAVMGLWGMKEKYYSFDKGDFHFVVLDCNYILKEGVYLDFANANYYIDRNKRDWVNPEQIEWLRADLEKTSKQTIIISHQGLDEIWSGPGVPNRQSIRNVLEAANQGQDFPKVIACFCGHHHLDDHSIINGIHYFQMNSASYYYTGDGFGSDGAKAVYRDPLFAFVQLDPSGKITIEGRESQFNSPTPADTHFKDAARISATITNRKESFTTKGRS